MSGVYSAIYIWYRANVKRKILKNPEMSEARKLYGILAHNLSGLDWSPMEVTDETDRNATGNPEDAI
jgi:hypothetical protein